MHYRLELTKVCFWVHLGASAQEQFEPQPVYVDITLIFKEKPRATTTDKLEDTVCYATLIKGLRDHVKDQTFSLIECFHNTLALYLTQQGHSFELAVHKVRVPIPGVERVTFRCGSSL